MIKKEMRAEIDTLTDMVDEGMAIFDAVRERLAIVRRELHNRPPTTRGEPVAVPVTPELIKRVWEIHLGNVTIPQHIIGEMVGLQQGRISEILSGIRT